MEYYLSTKAFKNLSDTSYLSLRFLNALVDRQHSIATFGLLLGSSIVLITPCHIPDIRHLNKSVTSKCCYIKIVVQPSELVKIITMAKKTVAKVNHIDEVFSAIFSALNYGYISTLALFSIANSCFLFHLNVT